MKITKIFLAIFAVFLSTNSVFAFDWSFSKPEKKRDYLHIVGSSTISPFMATISAEFQREQNLKNFPTKLPIVESTGTREGFKLFCQGAGKEFPDFVNASRPIEESESATCAKNGVENLGEIKIGYDGIVIAENIGAKKIKLSKEQIFLALAQKIYDAKSHKIIENPYQTWNEIDATLPKTKIIIFGPPLTSGTRDIFAELVLEDVCLHKKEFISAFLDENLRKKQCAQIREDGHFIESGENDNFIISELKKKPDALGIFGFNFLVANKAAIQAVAIDGVLPSFQTISNKKYKISRPLFVYFKKQHLDLMPEMTDFIQEIISPEVIGSKGYLLHSGLIALTDAELRQVRTQILSELKK
jgi:phosphate transport system substrate-binding protein